MDRLVDLHRCAVRVHERIRRLYMRARESQTMHIAAYKIVDDSAC